VFNNSDLSILKVLSNFVNLLINSKVEEIMNQIQNQFNSSDMSDKFMEEILAKILYKMYNGKKMKLTDWNFEEEFTKDDNSIINKGTLHGIINGSSRQQVQVNFVVKSISKNIDRRKTFKNKDFFCNKIFYTKMRKKYETFFLL